MFYHVKIACYQQGFLFCPASLGYACLHTNKGIKDFQCETNKYKLLVIENASSCIINYTQTPQNLILKF